MTEKRKRADEDAAQTGRRPVSDMMIIEEVLGHRSGYRRGFGYGMPIDEHRIPYDEHPRHEDLVHSEYNRTGQDQKVDRLQQQVEWLMNYICAPPMSSSEQYPPHQQSAPYMGTSDTTSNPQVLGFMLFTPVASHPPPQHGYYEMPSQLSMFPHAPYELPRDTSTSFT